MSKENPPEELKKPLTRNQRILLEIENLDSLEFDCDLVRFPVTLSNTVDGKRVKTEYYLRELMAFEYEIHEEFNMVKHREAEKAGDEYIDTKDMDSHLISLCMFYATGKQEDKPVSLEDARKIPERIQNKIAVKCKELNGMVSLEHVKKQ